MGRDDNQYFWERKFFDAYGYYIGSEFIELLSGLCLDVEGVRTGGNDARLTLWHCSESDDHLWWLFQV